jgi:hypothetical protein
VVRQPNEQVKRPCVLKRAIRLVDAVLELDTIVITLVAALKLDIGLAASGKLKQTTGIG